MMADIREAMPESSPMHADQREKGFSKIRMLLDATGGLTLSQVCSVTGLEDTTIQNWVKRGWVAHPKGKKYEEMHIARIMIINALKECIKLEHISLLMKFVNSSSSQAGGEGEIIKESELYDYLCAALQGMGQAEDFSRSGVEAVVDTVIVDYEGQKPDSRVKIRKALTLMIFACVCTDVKRRTDAMMGQILHDLENPEEAVVEETQTPESVVVDTSSDNSEIINEARKTVSQALREWDISSVERVIIDHREAPQEETKEDEPKKTSYRPWYSRKK